MATSGNAALRARRQHNQIDLQSLTPHSLDMKTRRDGHQERFPIHADRYDAGFRDVFPSPALARYAPETGEAVGVRRSHPGLSRTADAGTQGIGTTLQPTF